MVQVAIAQQRKYAVANAHAHNDYIHPVPFWTAYKAGFGSIEADIFLRNNELYVAHDTATIAKDRTLKALYLNPLKEVIKENDGFVYADSSKKLLLLIDLKTEAVPTLKKLIKLLKEDYKRITDCSSLQIVITGNQPPIASLTSYPNFIHFDGNLRNSYPKSALQKIALFSDKFTDFTKWKGEGEPPVAEKALIKQQIDKAHALHKPIRFWAAPDSLNAWQQLMQLGVDYINTDRIHEISLFFKQLPENGTNAGIK